MIYGYIRVSTDKQTVKVARLVPTLREARHTKPNFAKEYLSTKGTKCFSC